MKEKAKGHKCPFCSGARVSVYDSKPMQSGASPVIRRCRKCLSCLERWTTYEISAEAYERVQEAFDSLQTIGRIAAVIPAPNLPPRKPPDVHTTKQRRSAIDKEMQRAADGGLT